jgi:N-acetylneuraminate synthase/N,N'-diacetyllegionaminate synthase
MKISNNVRKIKIANKIIGDGEPVFIIAEAGVNHQGSFGLAKKLIDVAKEAGADAVKFQTFKAKDVVTNNLEMAEYQKKNVGEKGSQFEMLKKLELSHGDFIGLKEYADKKGIIFLSTPDTEEDVYFLERMVPAYKIGSADLTNHPLLEKVARKKKPIILSTGTATLKEVEEAVSVIKTQGNGKIILLHCTTNYPCPLKEVNLRAIETLRKKFKCLVGYSDHTLGMTVPIMATVLGVQILEKHFTLDKNLVGPDHKASLNPQELKEMVKAVREAEKAVGDGIKKPTQSEGKIKKIIRKSLVAKINIPKGARITERMIIIKRPGKGIKPKYLNRVIGKRAKKAITEDEFIKFKDFI